MNISKSGVAISLNNIKKTFNDGTLALSPLNLDIHPGEILVLLGPSGCGKTTTLRLIAGLEFADSGGDIHFGEKNVTNLPIEKRHVGMVFQSYALFPNMNVRENIEYGLKVRKETKEVREQKVVEMLAMFDLTPYAERKINQLSGGQRQRVALARAIITEPDVLLLDEPLSALDAQLKQRLRGDIHALLKRLGITAIYVTHDQEEAMVMGDRIAVLDKGHLAQIGSAEELYLTPKNRFVADFIGQMNCISGIRQGNLFCFGQGHDLSLEPHQLEHFSEVQPLSAMIRPEDITIHLEPTTPSNLWLHAATIVNHQFLGDRTRLQVEIKGLANPLMVDCFARREYQIDQAIFLSIDPQRLVLFKGEVTC